MRRRMGRPGLLGTMARTAVVAGTAAAQAPAADRVGQLTALAELKAKGLLTDEEFAAEKARVLGA
ncbi:SHOCT domain-containing protein [Streptomyces sp. H27-H1]|uniref:SHOCT domain-containing protein n=1 Tax=Streptomyces sp. H27-H1 TaxID=2996461 RepID=UPI00227144FE|nr:SHOCT domain-containing protein [Streptomyces sp. H27-H1]MCY0931350.1 SHOCT domain-containing protein [Streptomyces sp. H27-H1]